MNIYAFCAILAAKEFVPVTLEQAAIAVAHDPLTLEDAFGAMGIRADSRILAYAQNSLIIAEACSDENDFRTFWPQEANDFWEQAGGEYPEVELKDDNARRVRKDDPAGSQGSHKSVSGNSRSAGAKSVTANVRKLDKNARRS